MGMGRSLKKGDKIAYKKDVSYESILKLMKEGKNQSEISKLLNTSRTTVWRRMNELVKKGDLTYDKITGFHIVNKAESSDIAPNSDSVKVVQLNTASRNTDNLENKAVEEKKGQEGYRSSLKAILKREPTQQELEQYEAAVKAAEANIAPVLKELDNNDKKEREEVDWLRADNNRYTEESRQFTRQSFFETMIKLMREGDLISIPVWVFKHLHFSWYKVLDSDNHDNYMEAIGTIKLNSYSEDMIVIVEYDTQKDYVRIRMKGGMDRTKDNKHYDIELMARDYRR